MDNDYYDPCMDCKDFAYCNIWDKDHCCKRCMGLGLEHCDNCEDSIQLIFEKEE